MVIRFRAKIDNKHGRELETEAVFQLAGGSVRRGILRRAVAGEEAPSYTRTGKLIRVNYNLFTD